MNKHEYCFTLIMNEVKSMVTTTKINVYDASFIVAFKTMSSFNYVLMFNDIEFKVSLYCVIFTLL